MQAEKEVKKKKEVNEKYSSIITKDIDKEIVELLEKGKSPKEIKEIFKEKYQNTYHSRIYRTRNKLKRLKDKNNLESSDDFIIQFQSKSDILPEIKSKKKEKEKKEEKQESEFKINHVDVRNLLNNINESLLGGSGENKIGWSQEEIEAASRTYARALAKVDSEKVKKTYFTIDLTFTTLMLILKPIYRFIQLKNIEKSIKIKEKLINDINNGKIDPSTLTKQEKEILGYT